MINIIGNPLLDGKPSELLRNHYVKGSPCNSGGNYPDVAAAKSCSPKAILVVADKPSDLDSLQNGCGSLIFPGALTAKRNAGVDNVPASSALLLFVDDDVELHQTTLDTHVNYLLAILKSWPLAVTSWWMLPFPELVL